MKNLTNNPIYNKARKTLINRKQKLEVKLKNYLETEVAPSIVTTNFDNEDYELDYYAKICIHKNIYFMLIEFDKNNIFLDDKDKSRKLIEVGKVISNQYADFELRYLLNSVVKELYKDVFTLSAFIWSCIHTQRYTEAAKNMDLLSIKYVNEQSKYNSFKKALSTRVSGINIDDFLRENSVKDISNKSETEKKLTEEQDIYLTLYNEKKYKEIADVMFGKFQNSDSAKEIIDFINFELKISNKFSIQALSLIMINLGKSFTAVGKREIEISLIEELLKLRKNTLSMRAAFWAYYKQGNINKSRETLDWLEDFAKKNGDSKQLEFVRSKRQTYLFIDKVSIEEEIDKAEKEVIKDYHPIPNSVAYVLHNTLPYASGGYATRGHGLAEAVQKRGYSVTMVGRPGFPLDIKKEMTSEEVETIQFIDGINYTFTLSPRRDETVVQDFIFQASEELYKKFLELRPSFVVAASNHLTGLPALIAARRLGIPFVYEVRGFWEVTRISREPEFKHTEFYKILCELETIVAARADHVFTLTTPMAEELERRGVNKHSITILPNSCNPERFEPKSRDMQLASALDIPAHIPVIGYIGTFVQYEGLEHLAEACGLLKQQSVEFRLLIVGNENTAGDDKGPITKAIESIAKQYQFEDWLIMPGRVPHEEVESYYSLVDIAPFPRKPQPVTEMVSPMKPLEAAAMKKAIVVSSVRALTDMITDHSNGLVFEKGNVEHLSSKLLQLIESEELRIQLGENARQWVEVDRTWEKTAQKFVSLLENISDR